MSTQGTTKNAGKDDVSGAAVRLVYGNDDEADELLAIFYSLDENTRATVLAVMKGLAAAVTK